IRNWPFETLAVTSLAFSPDGNLLASGTRDPDDAVRGWDVAKGEEGHCFKGQRRSRRVVAFSPKGRVLADAGEGKGWDLGRDGLILDTGGARRGPGGSVAFSLDGKRVAFGGGIWSLESGKQVATMNDPGNLYSIAFSPDGNLLAGGSSAGGSR